VTDDRNQVAVAHAAPAGVISTVEAVVIKADGRRVDHGVIASSAPERVPLSERPEEL
jgi:predicted thioesterase